ncbi:MAG: GNAT family N-acetyltransferase [Planctomycetota bacterium]|nr:GNAT family N-acetyltransferase [Planctomycetota bacterium]
MIRPAQPADVDACVELLGTLFSIEQDFAPDPERQRNGLLMLINSPGAVLVAEKDQRVVAMVTCQVLISTAEGGPVGILEDMVVAAAYRGRGIGSELLSSLATWARGAGLSRLQLLADRDNLAALDFYLKHAWDQTSLIALRLHP